MGCALLLILFFFFHILGCNLISHNNSSQEVTLVNMYTQWLMQAWDLTYGISYYYYISP